MSLKVVFLFALVALAYGAPASEAESEMQAAQEVPVEFESYLNSLLPGKDGDTSLTMEPQSDDVAEDRILTRHRRACRTVSVRTKSGRVISVRRC